MQIKITTESLMEILPLLVGLARTAGKNTEDKSEFIVLSAQDNIAAFRIDTGSESLEVGVECETLEVGNTFLPLAKFVTVVSNTNADVLTISTSNTESGGVGVRITGTNLLCRFAVKFLEFLPPEWKAPDLQIPIAVEVLRAVIQRVKKALVDGGAVGFQAIRLVFRPSGVWAVAASNHKIAGASFKSEAIINRADALIPVQFLASFEQVLSKLDGEINLGVSSSKLTIEAEGIRYSTLAAIEGPPNVAQLFRTDGMNSCVIDSKEFLAATKIVSASTKSDGYCAVSFMRDGVKISGAEDGNTATKIAVSDVQTDCELTQGFNLGYLSDVCGKSTQIRIFFGRNEMDRTIWEHVNDVFGCKYVLVPSRIT